MIGLFRSNNRVVIFSKTEQKFVSQQTRKGPYIYDFHIEVGWGGLKIRHVFADFFLFLNKRSIVHFCKWRGLGVTQMVIFFERHKYLTHKCFKITTNSVIIHSSFFLQH